MAKQETDRFEEKKYSELDMESYADEVYEEGFNDGYQAALDDVKRTYQCVFRIFNKKYERK